MSALRVGIDVGGTFTKAVAVEPGSLALRAQTVTPTTHAAEAGVTEGVASALRGLLAVLGNDRAQVELVAFSTTQAMNALLEGDVPRVGVVGMGCAPDTGRARKRTRVGEVKLAPGRSLATEHEFIDATGGVSAAEIDAALRRLVTAGCEAIAVSGAFSVDGPEYEVAVIEAAAALGLSACGGHELSGTYGLEMRTVSAVINAAILPVVARTATMVERALAEAGLDVPLLVLRGDGGAMSVAGFRRRPSFTVGSGPAAGVAAALHQLGIADALVVECGGTSSNVSVVKGGRPVLRSLKVMGRPTAIRAIDSWVVGAAGGSQARVGRRGIAEVGPRSAHISGLPYATFVDPAVLADAQLELGAPRPGDPHGYAVVRAGDGRYALTATCAANALGLVPEIAYAAGSQDAALAAFALLARRLRTTPEGAARKLLDGAVEKITTAVAEAARQHDLGAEVPIVVLGGAGEALVPAVAERLGRPLIRPQHPEVLSSIGAALALVRAEVTRTATQDDVTASLELVREAELSCVAVGAAPDTVTVETVYDTRAGVYRATATGSIALEVGAAGRGEVDSTARLMAACAALGLPPEELSLLSSNDFYRVYSENGSGRVAVVDPHGTVALTDSANRIFAAEGAEFLERLRQELDGTMLDLGVVRVLPRVSIVCGPRILDLSHARREAEVLAAAEQALAEHPGEAVAVLVR
jgi:N-methylhydantoinase A